MTLRSLGRRGLRGPSAGAKPNPSPPDQGPGFNRPLGVAIALVGLLVISPDAGLTAFIQLEPSTLSMFRGLGMLVTMALFSLLFYGRGLLSYFNELPWQAWMIPPLYAVVPIMWIYGVKYAGAGQVLAVLAIAPLVAALSSRWFLGERLEWATIVASLIALIGILVTVFPLFEGHLPPQILSMIEATPARALLDQATTATVHGEAVGAHGTLAARHPLYGLGVLFSLLIPVIYAVMLTFSRKVPRANSWPLIALAGLMMAIIGGILTDTYLPQIDMIQWTAVAVLCLFVGAVSTGLLTLATRFTTSADVSLIVMLEPVAGLVYLWFLVREVPSLHQWVGGGIVFVTVGLYLLFQVTRGKRS